MASEPGIPAGSGGSRDAAGSLAPMLRSLRLLEWAAILGCPGGGTGECDECFVRGPGNGELYAADAHKSNATRLTTDPEFDGGPDGR